MYREIIQHMKEWEPIVSKQILEPFVEEKESQSIVGAVFTGIGLMVLATFVALMFYWAYLKEKTLFIAVFSVLILLFAIKMMILVIVIRKKLNPIVFKVYMGSTAFMTLFAIFNIIFFSIKASQRLRSPSSSSSYIAPPAYMPSNDQE